MSRLTTGFLARIAVGSATEGFPQILPPFLGEVRFPLRLCSGDPFLVSREATVNR
jgi:hypothetical protein